MEADDPVIRQAIHDARNAEAADNEEEQQQQSTELCIGHFDTHLNGPFDLSAHDAQCVVDLLLERYSNDTTTTIDTLRIHGFRIQDTAAATVFCRGVDSCTFLTTLNLANCNFGPNSNGILARYLVPAIANSSSITSVGLASTNLVGAHGGEIVRNVLIESTNNINSNLVELDVNENHFGPEGARLLGQGLIINNRLEKLYMSGCNLGNEDLANLMMSGPAGTTCACAATTETTRASALTHLDVSDNYISGAIGGERVVQLLRRRFPRMQNLNVGLNPLGPLGALALSPCLLISTTIASTVHPIMPALETLDLSSCELGNEGIMNLVGGSSANTTRGENDGGSNTSSSVAHLILSFNSIRESRGGESLGALLSHFTSLQVLDLNSNPLGRTGALGLAKGLQQQQHRPSSRATSRRSIISRLDVSACNLGDDGIHALLNLGAAADDDDEGSSSSNSSYIMDHVEELDIHWNEITSRGLESIVKMLRGCKKLTMLDIADNENIFQNNRLAVEAFADALSLDERLREVTIYGNIMDGQTQTALLAGLNKNSTLHAVYVRNGTDDASQLLTPENERRLESILQRNEMITNARSLVGHGAASSTLQLAFYSMSRRHAEEGATAAFIILGNHVDDIVLQTSS